MLQSTHASICNGVDQKRDAFYHNGGIFGPEPSLLSNGVLDEELQNQYPKSSEYNLFSWMYLILLLIYWYLTNYGCVS